MNLMFGALIGGREFFDTVDSIAEQLAPPLPAYRVLVRLRRGKSV